MEPAYKQSDGTQNARERERGLPFAALRKLFMRFAQDGRGVDEPTGNTTLQPCKQAVFIHESVRKTRTRTHVDNMLDTSMEKDTKSDGRGPLASLLVSWTVTVSAAAAAKARERKKGNTPIVNFKVVACQLFAQQARVCYELGSVNIAMDSGCTLKL